MTNMRVNKLLYFAQVHSLARSGEPLFSDNFSAWPHGPVIEDIYHEFKSYGRDPITAVSEGYSQKIFSDKQIALLLDVEREYRQYSTYGLADITHKEDPWKKAWNSPDRVISMESLKDHASHLPPLPEFKVPYSSADVTRFHDAEGHLILPKGYEDILDE